MSRLDRFATGFCRGIIRFRFLVILLTLAVVGAAGYGGQLLGFDTNYRVFFGKSNPQLQAFEELQAVYTKTDNVLFVIKPESGNVFEPETLQLVQELTKDSWQLPYATRVDSISNYQHTYAEGDDLSVVDLVEGDVNALTSEDLQALKEIAVNEPTLAKRLISEDGSTTGVNITFYIPEKHPFEVPEIAGKARELIAKYQEKYPNIQLVPTGMVFMNNAFAESSQNDLMTLIPIMYGILIVMMMVLLRSIPVTFAVVFVIAFSAVFAMGMGGWFGIRLTPPSSMAPTIILTLAIADSIHIIMSMIKELGKGQSKHEAIVESIRINFQPIFLTSVTTAIGFLSLNFSDAPPFHDLGNITATGVIAAFFFSIFFLPAALSLLPAPKPKKSQKNVIYDVLAVLTVQWKKPIIIVSMLIIGFLGFFATRLDLNDQFVQYFDYSIPFRGNAEFAIENLTGLYLVEYSVAAQGEEGISDPEYLVKLEEFSRWLETHSMVQHVYSITDIFKRLNKNMHGDDPEWYRLPESKEMAAQYLLLYEFSLPYGLDLNDRINVDKSASRLTVTTYDISTKQMRQFKRDVEAWMQDNLPEYMQSEATGPTMMFAYISERNIKSMLKGNTFALVLISICILLALRSFKMGAISLVPNLVPAILGFGLWSILVGQVNMAVALVAAVSLGIIVDDTVHFLSKYYRARREKNLSSAEAIHYAFNMVGSALVVTTAVLVVGFSFLMFSGFQVNKTLGLLTAVIITCALITDFILLPALLAWLDKDKGKKGVSK